MTAVHPQIAVVRVVEGDKIPLSARPYVEVDVAQRVGTSPPPRTDVGEVRGTVVWGGDGFKFLLKSGDDAEVAVTLWDHTGIANDTFLGRAVWTYHRHNPPTTKTLNINLPSGLAASVTIHIKVYTSTLMDLKPRRRTPTDAFPPSQTRPDEWCSVMDMEAAKQLVSRSMLGYVCKRLLAATKELSQVKQELSRVKISETAAVRKLEDHQGMRATQDEMLHCRIIGFLEQEEEMKNEVSAALQALEASEDNLEKEKRERNEIDKKLENMIKLASKYQRRVEEERGRNVENAAVEALLSGGAGDVIASLEEQVRTLTKQNAKLQHDTRKLKALEEAYSSLVPPTPTPPKVRPQKETKKKMIRTFYSSCEPHTLSHITSIRSDLETIRLCSFQPE